MYEYPWKKAKADIYLVKVEEVEPPERRLLRRMKARRFYVIDYEGDIRYSADVFLFRIELKQNPERLKDWLAGEFAAAGWFTVEELRNQVAYLKRAFREREDTALERRYMAGFTLARSNERRPRKPEGYMWNDEVETWAP